jgi:hypothetical protein
LARRLAELAEQNDQLRGVLLRHKRGLTRATRDLERGDLTIETLRTRGAPGSRQALTDAIDSFEKARHQVRLAITAFLMEEQDASVSDIGRALGISRQLSSRLAKQGRTQRRR